MRLAVDSESRIYDRLWTTLMGLQIRNLFSSDRIKFFFFFFSSSSSFTFLLLLFFFSFISLSFSSSSSSSSSYFFFLFFFLPSSSFPLLLLLVLFLSPNQSINLSTYYKSASRPLPPSPLPPTASLLFSPLSTARLR